MLYCQKTLPYRVQGQRLTLYSIWLIYFVASTQEVVVRTLNPFVVSTFNAHSLTAVVGVISSLFGGLSKLVIAKLLDTWGRPHGLVLTMIIWVLGFILMASCNSVEMYCAAQVFSLVGYDNPILHFNLY